jgi:hypothetical protein
MIGMAHLDCGFEDVGTDEGAHSRGHATKVVANDR